MGVRPRLGTHLVPAVVLLAAGGLGSCGEPVPRGGAPAPPAGEVIAARLLDELERAELERVPPALRPEGASGSEAPLVVLDWRGGEPPGPEWVGLFSGASPRHEIVEGASRLAESACAVVPASPGMNLRLEATLEADRGPPTRLGELTWESTRYHGALVALELDRLPSRPAEGCRPDWLFAHTVATRTAARGRALSGPAEVAFAASTATRAIAVVLATDLTVSRGLRVEVADRPGAHASLSALRLTREGPSGLSLEEMARRHPPEVPSPTGAGRARLGATLEQELADALATPPGAAVCFRLERGLGAALRTALGVDWGASATPARPVTFRVTVDGRALHEEEVGPEQIGWLDRHVPLGGRGPARLCLETEADGAPGTTWALWANPQVVELRTEEPGRPETIVLVSIDTLRADRLGLYGYGPRTSPVLDSLGAESVVWDRHYAQTGWTLPSHVSMLTGLGPEAHGLSSESEGVEAQGGVTFDPSTPTLAAALRRAGYSTHAIVSGPYLHPSFGFGGGFDSYDFSTLGAGQDANRTVTSPAALARFEEVLDRVGGRPAFVFLHLWDVHYDYLPPGEDLLAVYPALARLPLDYDQVRHPQTGLFHPALHRLIAAAWPIEPNRATARRLRRALPRLPEAAWYVALLSVLYDGEIRATDRHLGELVEALERRGRLEDAVLAVTSDHGEAFLEHGTFGHALEAVHDEGLLVPLVIHAPGRLAPGRRDELCATVDVPATLLALAGLPPLEGGQGRSLVRPSPADLVVSHSGPFRRAQAESPEHRLLVWDLFGPDDFFARSRPGPGGFEPAPGRLGELEAMRREVALYLLGHGRGLHVAVEGALEPVSFRIELESDSPLGPFFAYGPPETGAIEIDEEGARLALEATPGPGQIVALTVLADDRARVRVDVTADERAPAEGRVLVGAGQPIASDEADESWRIPRDGLPAPLGSSPGTVHLWRTAAGASRLDISLPAETLEQLEALGYIRRADGPPR